MSKDNEDLVRRVEEAWDANDLVVSMERPAPVRICVGHPH